MLKPNGKQNKYIYDEMAATPVAATATMKSTKTTRMQTNTWWIELDWLNNYWNEQKKKTRNLSRYSVRNARSLGSWYTNSGECV